MDPEDCPHIHRTTDIDTDVTECDDCGVILHGMKSIPLPNMDAFPPEESNASPDGEHEYQRPSWPPLLDPKMPVGLIFKSSSESYPHIVGVINDSRQLSLTCTCKAMLSIGIRPEGCWAMQRARGILLTDAPTS